MEQSLEKYWHSSQLKSTKGIFLLLHGLNLKPERMSAICAILTHEGYDVFCPPLSCHRPEEDNLFQQKYIKPRQWLSDFHEYYEYLTLRTGEKIHIAAFSLGGAVALKYLLIHKPRNMGMLILLEPATHLSTQLKLMIWLSRILSVSPGLGVPSANLPGYRVEASTSVAAYQALSALGYRGIERADAGYLEKINALVIFECKSEALSGNKTRRDFERLGWKVISVSNKLKNNTHPVFKWIKPTVHHLIIDESVTDAQCWKQIREAIVGHIRCG